MTPSSQEMESPEIPGRFNWCLQRLKASVHVTISFINPLQVFRSYDQRTPEVFPGIFFVFQVLKFLSLVDPVCPARYSSRGMGRPSLI